MSSHQPTSMCMRHEPQSRRFVNTLGDGRVILKLQSACDAIEGAYLVWRDGRTERKCELARLGNVNGNEFFSATVPTGRSGEYVFHVQACGQPRWFTPQGLQFNSSTP